MDVRLVPVGSCVDLWEKVVATAKDFPIADRVVSTWVAEHGAQHGDRIQARVSQIYSENQSSVVWVVVTRTGLVLSVSEPPVGVTLPGGIAGVYLFAETP